jgi:hypothetical protein
MTLYDHTERYGERPMPAEPKSAVIGPLAGFRQMASYEAGLAGSALTDEPKVVGELHSFTEHRLNTCANFCSRQESEVPNRMVIGPDQDPR